MAGWVLPQQGNCFSPIDGASISRGAAQPANSRSMSKVPGPLKTFEEALVVLEHVGGGVEAALGQQRGEQAVAAALADMERLRHRAEIGLEAGGKRCGEGERHGRPLPARA